MEPRRVAELVRVLLVVVATMAVSCTASPDAPATIRVVNWWSSAGETDARTALIDRFRDLHTDQRVNDTPSADATAARDDIRQYWTQGRPPETFQANGGWDLLSWVLYDGVDDVQSKMEPIDQLASAWKSQIPAPVLQTVTCKGTVYGVPLDIHRLNTLFYNQQLFTQYGLSVPTTLAELFAVAQSFQDAGVVPIALGSKEPWTVSLLLFENLLVAHGGGVYYRDYFRRYKDPAGPEMTAALADLARLLTYTNTDRARLTWDGAVALVEGQRAAMTIMGDWTNGHITTTQDVAEVAMPDTGGTFVFTTDTFGLPLGVANRAGTLQLLDFMGSKEGQEIFSPPKGSIPPRDDAENEITDARAQATIAAFRAAAAGGDGTLVPATSMQAPPAFMNQMNQVLGDFADSTDPNVVGNASIVLDTLRNWYDELGPSFCER
jgi:glucose/mannose transport system substrate-binding protein